MDLNEYQILAHRTSAFSGNDLAFTTKHITMAVLGLCGEAGEVADLFKKLYFHGHVPDHARLRDELGDVLWYVSELCCALGMPLDEIAASNIAKLQSRYGNAFSTEASINRKD